jgi:hypothetical protein
VQQDMSEDDWHRLGAGELVAPDGRAFARRSTRAKRAVVDSLVADGCPLVTYSYGAGELRWHDGDDALARWAQERQHVTSGEPKPSRTHTVWTAGLWEENEGGVVVVLTGYC